MNVTPYSFGSGPCTVPWKSYAVVPSTSLKHLDEILYKEFRAVAGPRLVHGGSAIITSLRVEFVWSSLGNCKLVRCVGFIDRTSGPPNPKWRDDTEYRANIWFGSSSPSNVTGSINDDYTNMYYPKGNQA
jgi:hypothetical protein